MRAFNLQGAALDWAVAKCYGYDEGWLLRQLENPDPNTRAIQSFSTDWAQGGPILAQTSIEICHLDNGEWRAQLNAKGCGPYCRHYGPTPLIAAMRCYVASRLGNEVEISNEVSSI